jgi:putative ABC transport system ATP-binding protein
MPETGMEKKTVIQVQNLLKTYKMGEVEVKALRGVNLIVTEGEFVAIMGPSGSGKSTFMNILGCLDDPTSGTYLLDGVDVKKRTPSQLAELRNRKIGFVFQSYNLLSRTSALENVELPMLYNSKINSHDRKEMAMEALKSVGLGGRYASLPNQLSGGQQQRVAIARAIVTSPVLILADEPTGNLDTRTSIEVMEIFQRMNSLGKTIVLVTHELDIATFTGRNVQFKDGLLNKDIIVEKPKDAKTELAALPVQLD